MVPVIIQQKQNPNETLKLVKNPLKVNTIKSLHETRLKYILLVSACDSVRVFNLIYFSKITTNIRSAVFEKISFVQIYGLSFIICYS